MVFVTTSSHPSRRRAIVFAAVFLPAVIGSLVYVYTRPPEYRAVARLQISPASVVTQPAEATDTPTLAPDPQGFSVGSAGPDKPPGAAGCRSTPPK